jgi:hypothetical protein
MQVPDQKRRKNLREDGGPASAGHSDPCASETLESRPCANCGWRAEEAYERRRCEIIAIAQGEKSSER